MELKDRLENELFTRTFKVSGMPESTWNIVNEYCKERYGDSRWIMISDLVRKDKEDYKYHLIMEEIQGLKEQLALLKDKEEPVNDFTGIKTFGMKRN